MEYLGYCLDARGIKESRGPVTHSGVFSRGFHRELCVQVSRSRICGGTKWSIALVGNPQQTASHTRTPDSQRLVAEVSRTS